MKRTFVYVVASTAAVFLIPIFFHRSNCKCAKFEIAFISFACTIRMHIYFFKSDEQNEMVMNEFIFTYGVVQVCEPRSTMANVWHRVWDKKTTHIANTNNPFSIFVFKQTMRSHGSNAFL